MFSTILPLNLVIRIVDRFLVEGEVFLYKTAVGCLKIYQEKLLASSFEEILQFLKEFPGKFEDEFSALHLFENISVPLFINSLFVRLENQKKDTFFMQQSRISNEEKSIQMQEIEEEENNKKNQSENIQK